MVTILFYFSSRNPKKMFYWLKIMEYDYDNDCFSRMNLNESNSKMFIKQMSIVISALKLFCFVFMPSFFIITVFAVFKYLSYQHYFIHFLAILLFLPHFYLGTNFFIWITNNFIFGKFFI